MGGSSYNFSSRIMRSAKYQEATTDEIFEQNRKRQIHESMDPKKALLREARDSEMHPNSLPIILGLDVTGSMGSIPRYMVNEGLPKMVAQLMEKGIGDPAVLFLAIGDSKNDKYPLQVGQFESGDEELDMWLTRTYLEGGGGGNGGESYLWAWYYAARHCQTDAWDKRKQKGFLITFGDEPCHNFLTPSEVHEVMGYGAKESISAETLLKEAQERWEVFHLCLNGSDSSATGWTRLLGERAIMVEDQTTVDKVISDIIASNYHISTSTKPATEGKIML